MKEALYKELLQSMSEMKDIRTGKAKPSRSFTFDTPSGVSKVKASHEKRSSHQRR
jgi:hypothetical protein